MSVLCELSKMLVFCFAKCDTNRVGVDVVVHYSALMCVGDDTESVCVCGCGEVFSFTLTSSEVTKTQ